MSKFKLLIYYSALSVLLITISLSAKDNKHEKSAKKEVSIEMLEMNNNNFQNNKLSTFDLINQRKETAKGQSPHTIVLTCSDSRVIPEYIFNCGIGELFVVRTAGNVVDPVVLGSIEYAAEHLHSKKIVVMGHSSCGAVTAALAGPTESPNINSILSLIKPAVNAVKELKTDKEHELTETIYVNVRQQIKNLKDSKIINELIHEHEMEIVGAIYDLNSGKVEFFK